MPRVVWQTTLLFTCIGILWIVITDALILWLHLSLSPAQVLFYQTSKGIGFVLMIGLLLFFHLRRTTRKLEESQQHLQAITQKAQNRIWSVDKHLNFLFFNESFQRFFKSETGQGVKVGMSAIPQRFSKNRQDKLRNYYIRALANESFVVEDNPEVTGDELTQTISFNPMVTDDGKVWGVGCIATDITQRKKREELLKKQNALLREIATISSHETRRPVANILGLVEIIAKDHPDYMAAEPSLKYLLEEAKDLDIVIQSIVKKVSDVEQAMNKEDDPLIP